MRLIDADALIEQIEQNICKPCKERKDDYNGVRCRACQYGDEMDDIYDAPSVGEWIPCSERLPDDLGDYLVSVKQFGWNCEEYVSTDIAYWDDLEGFHKAGEVIAWMPLPEAWRGEEKEDET